MSRLAGWIGSKAKPHGSSQSLNALEEPSQIEHAMRAATHIMNDDVETAEAELSKGSSPVHKLCQGVVIFMRATLGFEQDVMREASERLADAEAAASEHYKRAQRHPNAFHSAIYPAGSEFALCLAEAQLMSAVVAVLNESLTESIKGFYKLRKAYQTLDALAAAEKRFVQGRSSSSVNSASRASTESLGSSSASRTSQAPAVSQVPATSTVQPVVDEDGDEFFDADETPDGVTETTTYLGELEINGTIKHAEKPSYFEQARPNGEVSQQQPPFPRTNSIVQLGPDVDLFGDHPVDTFIHSGSNLCFGILQLMISLIPPAFATLLKIVGFRGDRERGIQMLWQASRFNNINGAMAGLIILGYYNGIVGFCDILPPRGPGAYPRERCRALLADMRERYPRSHLWLLEEARVLAGDRQLERAVEILNRSSASPLKQVEALTWFERSLDSMYAHNYADCSASFQKCVKLNNWSHGLYYYIAGACHVELYRLHKSSDPRLAREHAAKAEELLKLVPKQTGRKRFMARQLPFDVFVNRKIQKWEHRAAEWGVEFVDAVGVSPIEEMIYFWNGYRRMRPEHLQVSLQRLAWSTSGENGTWEREALDEHAVLALLRAATLRNLKRFDDAKEILRTEILSHEWVEFKGHLRDSWTDPCAHYEMAANLWNEQVQDGNPPRDVQKIRECSAWLEKVAGWESYDLDARIGLKITTGRDTLKRLGVSATA
ncbi:Mitochondrial outer membrane protein iml2 [Coniosporium apollinis]|uniref:Inclusion body clearance protein IML2 n=1 Tax=Coniosporium apollinis TaxID=61459 RepID=A0ABQ9P1T9_9PEZI|nr:Mitochondrial outer membrane protein iml2 [Coniosporium apollinis]